MAPTPASSVVDAVQPGLQRLLGLRGVAAAEVVQRQADRPAERVAPEEAVQPVAGADAEEVAPGVVEDAVHAAGAAEVEVHLLTLRSAVQSQRRLQPLEPIGPRRGLRPADAAGHVADVGRRPRAEVPEVLPERVQVEARVLADRVVLVVPPLVLEDPAVDVAEGRAALAALDRVLERVEPALPLLADDEVVRRIPGPDRVAPRRDRLWEQPRSQARVGRN